MSRRSCPGLHCDGCPDGGGGALVAVLAVLAAIVAVVYHFRRGVETAVEITALTILGLAMLALAAGGAVVAADMRRAARRRQIQRAVQARAQVIRLGAEPERPAIEAPRQRPAWPLAGQWQEVDVRADRRSPS